MRHVDAEWDLRALGVTSLILCADDSTKPEHLATAVAGLHQQMVTVRLPAGKGDLQDWLQAHRFAFREVQFEFQSPRELTERVSRLDRPKIAESSPSDLSDVLLWLKNGLIANDRISIDSRFGPKQSGYRFAQFLSDEISAGASLKIVKWGDETAGWFCIRGRDGSPHVALSGVTPSASNPAAGFLLHRAILEEAMSNYSKPLTAIVSSLNLGALRAHQYFGYRLAKLEEVYVRSAT